MRSLVAHALSETELARAMAITDFFIVFLPIIELLDHAPGPKFPRRRCTCHKRRNDDETLSFRFRDKLGARFHRATALLLLRAANSRLDAVAQMKAMIHHNPACGTSRKTLEILRESGADVTVNEYLEDSARPRRAEAALRPRRNFAARRPARQGTAGRRARPDRARRRRRHDPRRDDGAPDPDQPPAGRDRQRRPPVPPAGHGPRNPLD